MDDSLNKLLDLGLEDIKIWKMFDGLIALMYDNSFVEIEGWYVGEFGKGKTIEEAADDYVKKINGKLLVFNLDEDEYKVRVRI